MGMCPIPSILPTFCPSLLGGSHLDTALIPRPLHQIITMNMRT